MNEFILLLAGVGLGYCLGVLKVKWVYHKKTGKHIQDL